jgi:hypothetical protein
MKRLQKAAVLADLISRLREHGSWCGETHVQKATYLLQELGGVDVGYEFVLYKHGPFAFDLRDDLGGFSIDGIIRYEPRQAPYGPRIAITGEAEAVQRIYPKTLERVSAPVEFVAEKIDGRGVVDLERLATALYVTTKFGGNVPDRARILCELKPHVPRKAAIKAVEEIDEIKEAAAGLVAPSF